MTHLLLVVRRLVVRRLLLVPSGLLAIFLGLMVFSYTEDFFSGFCPLELFGLAERPYNSGYLCIAEWYPPAETFAILLGAAVASASFVLLPALLEPTAKVTAAVIAYGIGAALSFPLVVLSFLEGAALPPALALLTTGLACAFVVKRWLKSQQKASV